MIKELYNPNAAPITLVYKKDENKKIKLCIDYRGLNKIVVPESQLFPRIEDLRVKVRICKYFTSKFSILVS